MGGAIIYKAWIMFSPSDVGQIQASSTQPPYTVKNNFTSIQMEDVKGFASRRGSHGFDTILSGPIIISKRHLKRKGETPLIRPRITFSPFDVGQMQASSTISPHLNLHKENYV